MPASLSTSKEITFNLRLDARLKSEFMEATEAEARSAAAVLRDLIGDYVREAKRKAFAAEAQRQSELIARTAASQAEEAEVMRWVDAAHASLPAEPDEWFRPVLKDAE